MGHWSPYLYTSRVPAQTISTGYVNQFEMQGCFGAGSEGKSSK